MLPALLTASIAVLHSLHCLLALAQKAVTCRQVEVFGGRIRRATRERKFCAHIMR
jgi:hypothetical protein